MCTLFYFILFLIYKNLVVDAFPSQIAGAVGSREGYPERVGQPVCQVLSFQASFDKFGILFLLCCPLYYSFF